MGKMVYLGIAEKPDGGEGVLSTGDVLRELGITKVTLYKWMYLKIIKARGYKIGSRTFYGFDQKEVDKVKKLIPSGRGKGRKLITEDVLKRALKGELK